MFTKACSFFASYSSTDLGELERDTQEDILLIVGRVDSKVKEVHRPLTSSRKNLKFDYDAMGNRIAKHLYEIDNITLIKSTYYLRDAQGNVMSIYEHEVDNAQLTVSYNQKEKHIYGSSRLGMRTDTLEMIGAIVDTVNYERILCKKQYELSNHLGNVLTVITDKKMPVNKTATPNEVDYFIVEILSATDYSPFGVTLNNRDFSNEKYKYGFNGHESVDEISGVKNHYTAPFWEMDPRLGRRWNTDPVVKPHESPYAILAGNPIWFVDPNGADTSFADNAARTQFNETYKGVDNAIKGFDKKIDNKLAKWQEKGYDNERVNKRMTRQIGKLNSQRSQLLEIKSSFDEVINSETMFHYGTRPNPDGKYLSGGGTFYNKDEDRVDIWFYSGLEGTLVHETRHGAGYSWGEWGWDNKTNSPTNYDYQDEYDAYRQESNYTRIILQGMGRSKLEIMNVIKVNYGTKDYIIKEFHQYCEPEKP